MVLATLCAADIVVSLENNEDKIGEQFEELLIKIAEHPDLESQAKYVCADAAAKLIDKLQNDNLASHINCLIGPSGLLLKMRFQNEAKVTVHIPYQLTVQFLFLYQTLRYLAHWQSSEDLSLVAKAKRS